MTTQTPPDGPRSESTNLSGRSSDDDGRITDGSLMIPLTVVTFLIMPILVYLVMAH